jgi:GNAT superfamily N-acetyltransferase
VFWASVAVLSAAFAWTLHHTPFFSDRGGATALIAVLMASAAAVLTVAFAANRRHAHPPVVIVAGDDDVRLREAGSGDIEFCASLHAQALNTGFFISLGPTFLRAYYESFLASPYARFYVATVKGHPVGMLVGLLRPRAHQRWLFRRRGFVLAVLGTGAMLTRPLLTLKFLRTRARSYRQRWRSSQGDGDETAESSREAFLRHVAVLAGARGAGIGRQLVRTFCDDAARDGCARVGLTTFAGEGEVRNFYLANGWVETGRREDIGDQEILAMAFDLARWPNASSRPVSQSVVAKR